MTKIFLKNLITQARPDMRDSSKTAYVGNLAKLMRTIEIGFFELTSDEARENMLYTSLQDRVAVKKYLRSYKPNTQKSYLNAIIVILKALTDNPKHPTYPSIEYYESLRDGYNQAYESNMAQNIKSDTMEANWVEWVDYERMVLTMHDECRRLKMFRKNKVMSAEERVLYGDYILTRLYQDFPLRNDYHDMRIIHSEDDIESKKLNYLLVQEDRMYIILNHYKTSATYGSKKIEVNPVLRDVILNYLRVNKSGYLLVNEKTNKALSAHQITLRLRRITHDRLGRNVGSNIIRHSYLSHKYNNVNEKQKLDSDLMMHSLSTQKTYIKKV